ncbi:MAG: FAD-dependent oxidoreductase [Chloroflexi bacterium]|nr:MAG: FAD-dependent oxidoreductase [Chloroflexota bacterium]
MARTPLMRHLQQLAHDHRLVGQRGIPLAAVREGREGITRRQFVKGGAAGAAGLALAGPWSLAQAAFAASPRIGIIGAGISGLTAALTLQDAGFSSTVYESSSRIGGRMHSDTSNWGGQTSEWCGELIDQGHKTILHLAQRFGLATVDLLSGEPNGSEDTYYFSRRYYPKSQADTDFQPVHQALQRDVQAASYPTTYLINTPGGIALDNISVYDWIERSVPGGHGSPMGQLLDVAYNIEYGAETAVQSSLNLVYLLGFNEKPGNFAIFGASNEKYHIVGGNQRLPEVIAANLQTKVQTGWRMTAIGFNRVGSIDVTFSVGGQTMVENFDRVILALPFAVLRTLNYHKANFDSMKNTAIQQLGGGRNDKLQLQFTSRYWDGTGSWPGIGNGNSYSDRGYQNTWDVTRSQTGTAGILVDYTGGEVAGSFAPSSPYSFTNPQVPNPQVRAYAETFLQQIERVYPGITSKWNGRATLSVPALDPNLNCSYSYWKVGQYHSFSGYEKARQPFPNGPIHFAGEHCSQDFQGFMEGGASEGVRAAGEILADAKAGAFS